MARLKKKELLEMVTTMKEANDFIKNASREQQPTISGLLEQCQQAAITIGNYIETKGEVGASIVALLEDYCESLYQQSINLEDSSKSRKISKKIQKQLSNLSNSIQYDLPEDKKEVVFLPYKASMWDSLESVWLSARDDENCDAYVIPIPYFDKNPDGSFGQMHYEGKEYPDYVPITSWNEYNIKERRPDAIYIHNPYDNWNYITSVYPDFYAEKLKDYTDSLVYIPYFVLGEIEPDNQVAIDNMKHFIRTPGVIYADKVIVQSEKMKQIYVNEYLKFAQELGLQGKHLDRAYQEERILGLGSPKIDKVISTKKEDLQIPEEWLKIIEKQDGSWKKIILYNTSVAALLEHNEKMLEKIEDVFQVFRENQVDVALLWRPHPLMENTIKSMRPQLWEKYKQIVERYKAENWGIYDDTAELERAITLSDAYYGDGSSVVQLYEKTGKALSIQEVESEYNTVCFLDSVVVEDELWFPAININGLYKKNFVNGTLEFIDFFPDEKINAKYLFSKILKFEDKLVFIPFNAKNLLIYEIKYKKFRTIKLNKNKVQYSLFYTALQEESNIYLIPCRYEKLVRYNMVNDEIEYYDIFNDINRWNKQNQIVFRGNVLKNNANIFKAAWKQGNKIYLGAYTCNFIEEFDISTGGKNYFNIPETIDGITHILFERGLFWIICRNGKIIKWDKEKNSYTIIQICKNNEQYHTFFDVMIYDNTIILTGTLDKKVYVYDIKSDKVNVINLEMKTNKKEFSDFWADFSALCILPNKNVGVVNSWENSLQEMYISKDLKPTVEKSHLLKLDKKDLKFQEKILEKYNSMRINGDLGIDADMIIELIKQNK